MPTNSPGSDRRAGFTLIELLVVIGIIVLLIAILLPTLTKVRQAAYVADTQSEISTIASACTAYYTDFSAYPGPFSNDQIELGTNNTSPPITPLTGPSGSPSYSGNISMPQNLVLGLLGGLTMYSTGGTTPPYLDTTSIGQGPLSLNSLSPGRKTSYITNVQGILSNGQFQDDAGKKAADNTGIPVFVDRFPSGTLPILYLRARTSALGVIDKAQGVGKLQYDVQQYAAYTSGSPSVLGAPQYGSPNYTLSSGTPAHGLKLEQGTLKYGAVTTDFPTNALVYFTNPSTVTSTTPSTVQLQGHPRQIDQFILIAAGKDGTYGTPDDITNYGGVSQ